MLAVVFSIVAIFLAFVAFGILFGAPYVPSLKKDIQRMFDEFQLLTPNDVVVDFGSGDGVVLREVSRRGARAVGYEVNPLLVTIAKFLSRGDVRVTVKTANFWRSAFPEDITILYAFSVTKDGKRLVKKIEKEVVRLEKPLTVICYGSPLPGIEPTDTFQAYTRYIFTPLQR